MKKMLIVLLTIIILLSFSSCARETEGYSIREALKISAIVFDESIEQNVYNKEMFSEEESFYALERLKMNEVKLMPPMGVDLWSLTFFIEFDGIIEVTSENDNVWVSYSRAPNLVNSDDFVGDSGSQSSIQFAIESYVSANPITTTIDDFGSGSAADRALVKVGSEWYLNVSAYRFDNEKTPIIKAQLKIVALYDKNNTGKTGEGANFGTRCFSVELVFYEYSDMYKFMDEIIDDDYD